MRMTLLACGLMATALLAGCGVDWSDPSAREATAEAVLAEIAALQRKGVDVITTDADMKRQALLACRAARWGWVTGLLTYEESVEAAKFCDALTAQIAAQDGGA